MIACKIVEKISKEYEDYEHDALTRKINTFENCNCMEIAAAAYDLNFMSQRAYQEEIDNLWYQTISPHTSKLKVF